MLEEGNSDTAGRRRDTISVAGVPFVATTLDEAARQIVQDATGAERRSGGLPIRLMNAYCVALASTDPEYMRLVNETGLNFPDGASVAWVMKRSSSTPSGQVRGPSFFFKTLEFGVKAGTRHYFFGTTDETLALMERNLVKRYPGVEICGKASAPFAPIPEIVTDEVVEAIEQARPDIVWVGLGTPKQDWVAATLAERTGLPVAAVGAAFDFAAGTVPEAPEVFQRFGMEWAYRFASEPRRLWKRYLWGNTRFIQITAPQVLRFLRSRER